MDGDDAETGMLHDTTRSAARSRSARTQFRGLQIRAAARMLTIAVGQRSSGTARQERARRDAGALVVVLGDAGGDGPDLLHERAQYVVDLVLEAGLGRGPGWIDAHDASAPGKNVVVIIVVGCA